MFIFMMKKNDDPQEGDRRVLSSGCNKEIGMNKNGSHINYCNQYESYTLKQYRTEVQAVVRLIVTS